MSTVLITGANRGIGLALCRHYCDRGDRVIAVCRKEAPELIELDLQIIDGIDVTENAAEIAAKIGSDKIDILINNAGILRLETSDDFNFDTMLEQFETNTLGPLKVTNALKERLSEGAKVAMVTSRMGSIADNDSGGYYGYRMSKAALNAASVSLARDLISLKISIAIIHPGYVKTDMTGHNGFIEPNESAAGIVARIDELSLDTSGTFWHSSGEVLPW